MWVDEETYNNMMLGTLVGTIIGLMIAAFFGIFRLAFSVNRWFYYFLKNRGLKSWQSFIVCCGITAVGFIFICSPIMMSDIKTSAQLASPPLLTAAAQPPQKIMEPKGGKTRKPNVRRVY